MLSLPKSVSPRFGKNITPRLTPDEFNTIARDAALQLGKTIPPMMNLANSIDNKTFAPDEPVFFLTNASMGCNDGAYLDDLDTLVQKVLRSQGFGENLVGYNPDKKAYIHENSGYHDPRSNTHTNSGDIAQAFEKAQGWYDNVVKHFAEQRNDKASQEAYVVNANGDVYHYDFETRQKSKISV